MVYAAYKDYKRWHNVWLKEARDEGHKEGRKEGREEERARLKREFAEQGITLPPEAERILSGEADARS